MAAVPAVLPCFEDNAPAMKPSHFDPAATFNARNPHGTCPCPEEVRFRWVVFFCCCLYVQ